MTVWFDVSRFPQYFPSPIFPTEVGAALQSSGELKQCSLTLVRLRLD
jgi:hypothetical protein